MTEPGSGAREIQAALAESRRLFFACAAFSAFVNLLMLTGPLFMLQVYDRVLPSRSEATLLTMIAIVAFLFAMMGVLDWARGRVLARAGARLQARLDSRVLRAVLDRSTSPSERSKPSTGPQDLAAIGRFAASTGPLAFFDAPWTPVFLGVLFVFHWTLGLLAVLSGLLLVAIALAGQYRTARLQEQLWESSNRSAFFIEQMRAGGETVHGLGMRGAVVERSRQLNAAALDENMVASDRVGMFHVLSRTLRLFLQSLMLGVGAWQVLAGEITAGLMIAASILLGRALAPIDQAIGQWPLLQRTLSAYRSLSSLLEESPAAAQRTQLPAPRALLEVQQVVVAPPGARYATVRGASLRLEPGQAAGIAGPSASGKTTLARALAGVWPPIGGSIRLDGAELEQYGEDLGRHVGYLPQEVVLFDGTVAENIARLSPDATDEQIVDAAKRTGAHEMILGLPDGYDFRVSAGGAALSGGQRQRIALARAFFGSPVLVVMDEPDSNLDAEGTMALARAVEEHKQRGGAAIIVAHRHGAFAQCDVVYLMENGRPAPAGRRGDASPVRSLQSPEAGDNDTGDPAGRRGGRAAAASGHDAGTADPVRRPSPGTASGSRPEAVDAGTAGPVRRRRIDAAVGRLKQRMAAERGPDRETEVAPSEDSPQSRSTRQ